ncbi:MAG: hypothetical protein KF782_35650, partial [Labilithrix sp.]|nr:hypothetical protein [Labilithrix sp.]
APAEEPAAAKVAPAADEPPAKAAKEPAAKAKTAEPASKAIEPIPRDSRQATTQKVNRKEKGIPWLWILVLAAAAFAGYRLWLARR